MDLHQIPEPTPGKEHAFMLRIWMEDLGDGQMDWRGKIQHINSGETLFFRDWQVLTRFIQRLVPGPLETRGG